MTLIRTGGVLNDNYGRRWAAQGRVVLGAAGNMAWRIHRLEDFLTRMACVWTDEFNEPYALPLGLYDDEGMLGVLWASRADFDCMNIGGALSFRNLWGTTFDGFALNQYLRKDGGAVPKNWYACDLTVLRVERLALHIPESRGYEMPNETARRRSLSALIASPEG